jgi:phosphoserine phosphatase
MTVMTNYHFAFDLDGTITKKELLPLISRELGIEEKMAELTRRTMAGDIPFEQSFVMRVDMLKKIPISRVQQIVVSVPLSQHILRFLHNNPSRCHIVTGNLDVWIALLIPKLGVDVLCSKANYHNETLYGIKSILHKKSIHNHVIQPVVAIGDGHNDLEMLTQAPISIAYGGVHPPAKSLTEIATYAIYQEEELCKLLKRLL